MIKLWQKALEKSYSCAILYTALFTEDIMKIYKKIAGVTIACSLSVLLLSGCTKGNKATQTTVYIDRNGKITEAIVEYWDQKYYDEDDLKSQIDNEIKQYEDENKDSSVKLNKFKVENKKIKVNLTYDSASTYSEFNNITAFCGTILKAQEEGFSFDGKFNSTNDKPSVTIEELDGSEEYSVYILSEKEKVNTEFKILYASENVKVSDNKKTAVISDEDENSLAYLIYKK